MTQHKVLSDDSMTAMDEIARVLGQDAVILSTKKIGEKIEIIGSGYNGVFYGIQTLIQILEIHKITSFF